ncbi:MAG: hypothetical protein MK193_05810 [Lentisphaeria bacterium]|nr:hypothetical protein [Lentisphaeria bacterium]
MSNPIQLACFPKSHDFWIRNQQLAQFLKLPTPIYLSHRDLYRTVGNVFEHGTKSVYQSNTIRDEMQIAGAGDSFILFSEGNSQIIKQVIMAYKKIGQWPMLAMQTEMSSKMRLGTLIEHINADRQHEIKLRKERLHKIK